MIKVEEFRGRVDNSYYKPKTISPAMQLEHFLEIEKISKEEIISINYSSDHGSTTADFYSILLVYEKESK